MPREDKSKNMFTSRECVYGRVLTENHNTMGLIDKEGFKNEHPHYYQN